jgi:hypothetical protein
MMQQWRPTKLSDDVKKEKEHDDAASKAFFFWLSTPEISRAYYSTYWHSSEIIWLAGRKGVWRLRRLPKKKTRTMTSQSFAFFENSDTLDLKEERNRRLEQQRKKNVLGLSVGANDGGMTPKRAK